MFNVGSGFPRTQFGQTATELTRGSYQLPPLPAPGLQHPPLSAMSNDFPAASRILYPDNALAFGGMKLRAPTARADAPSQHKVHFAVPPVQASSSIPTAGSFGSSPGRQDDTTAGTASAVDKPGRFSAVHENPVPLSNSSSEGSIWNKGNNERNLIAEAKAITSKSFPPGPNSGQQLRHSPQESHSSSFEPQTTHKAMASTDELAAQLERISFTAFELLNILGEAAEKLIRLRDLNAAAFKP